jgi:hypothetical protein
MRAITSQTAAQVLQITPKQLDNLLLRIGEVASSTESGSKGRQGRERRIPIKILPELALTLELVDGLGVGLRDGYRIASELCSGRDHEFGHLTIGTNLEGLRDQIDQRLAAAIETTVRAKRGRPPRSS